jgi:hypothetical protein
VSFALYVIGLIVFIAGLGSVATWLGLSQSYILAGALLLLAVGIFTAATRAHLKDPA